MKNNHLKISFLAGIAISLVLGIPTYGATGDDSSEEINVVSCLAQSVSTRGLSQIRFLSDAISLDGFFDDVIEPWGDIIFSNQCQAYDILALLERQDQIERSVRKSFLTCDLSQLEAQQRSYYRINAEIYYARHIVNRKVVAPVPYTSLAQFDVLQPDFAEAKGIHDKLQKRYVGKGKMSQQDFDDFYVELYNKYAQRKQAYKVCENASLQAVIEKWDEFLDSFEDIGSDFVTNVEKRSGNIGKAWDSMIHSYSSIDNVMASHLQSNIDADVPGALEELGSIADVLSLYGAGYKKDDPSKQPLQNSNSGSESNNTPAQDTYSGIAKRIENANDRVDVHLIQSDLESRFEAKYQLSNANIQHFLIELDKTNKAIKDSYPILDTVQSCSAEAIK